MPGVPKDDTLSIECPHCHKTFEAEPIDGGDAARYHGYKCPHCKLFVPLARATSTSG